MLRALPEKTAESIVRNILAACADISKLSKEGYQFLCLSMGFIAHYNFEGFKEHYGKRGALRREIFINQVRSRKAPMSPEDKNYGYYQQVEAMRNRICAVLTSARTFTVSFEETRVVRRCVEVTEVSEAAAVLEALHNGDEWLEVQAPVVKSVTRDKIQVEKE